MTASVPAAPQQGEAVYRNHNGFIGSMGASSALQEAPMELPEPVSRVSTNRALFQSNLQLSEACWRSKIAKNSLRHCWPYDQQFSTGAFFDEFATAAQFVGENTNKGANIRSLR